MPKFANPQSLKQLLTLVKGYVDENVRKKMDSFTPGDGLNLENGILTVTLNTDLFKVVSTLPTTPAASDANKIFLVLDSSNPESGNIYVEYLYTEEGWEEIGRRQVEMDMEPYLKKTELTATVSSTSFAIQKAGEQLGVLVFGSNDFQGVTGSKSLNVSLKDILAQAVSSGLYKISMDKKGRVTGYTQVQLSDLTALGVAKQSDLDATNQDLANEIQNRQTAVEGVNNNLNSAKETLGARIDGVQSSVNNLSNSLASEASSRESGDNDTLSQAQQLVNNEASSRQSADTALSNRIGNLETALDERPVITTAEVTSLYQEVYQS